MKRLYPLTPPADDTRPRDSLVEPLAVWQRGSSSLFSSALCPNLAKFSGLEENMLLVGLGPSNEGVVIQIVPDAQKPKPQPAHPYSPMLMSMADEEGFLTVLDKTKVDYADMVRKWPRRFVSECQSTMLQVALGITEDVHSRAFRTSNTPHIAMLNFMQWYKYPESEVKSNPLRLSLSHYRTQVGNMKKAMKMQLDVKKDIEGLLESSSINRQFRILVGTEQTFGFKRTSVKEKKTKSTSEWRSVKDHLDLDLKQWIVLCGGNKGVHVSLPSSSSSSSVTASSKSLLTTLQKTLTKSPPKILVLFMSAEDTQIILGVLDEQEGMHVRSNHGCVIIEKPDKIQEVMQTHRIMLKNADNEKFHFIIHTLSSHDVVLCKAKDNQLAMVTGFGELEGQEDRRKEVASASHVVLKKIAKKQADVDSHKKRKTAVSSRSSSSAIVAPRIFSSFRSAVRTARDKQLFELPPPPSSDEKKKNKKKTKNPEDSEEEGEACVDESRRVNKFVDQEQRSDDEMDQGDDLKDFVEDESSHHDPSFHLRLTGKAAREDDEDQERELAMALGIDLRRIEERKMMKKKKRKNKDQTVAEVPTTAPVEEKRRFKRLKRVVQEPEPEPELEQEPEPEPEEQEIEDIFAKMQNKEKKNNSKHKKRKRQDEARDEKDGKDPGSFEPSSSSLSPHTDAVAQPSQPPQPPQPSQPCSTHLFELLALSVKHGNRSLAMTALGILLKSNVLILDLHRNTQKSVSDYLIDIIPRIIASGACLPCPVLMQMVAQALSKQKQQQIAPLSEVLHSIYSHMTTCVRGVNTEQLRSLTSLSTCTNKQFKCPFPCDPLSNTDQIHEIIKEDTDSYNTVSILTLLAVDNMRTQSRCSGNCDCHVCGGLFDFSLTGICQDFSADTKKIYFPTSAQILTTELFKSVMNEGQKPKTTPFDSANKMFLRCCGKSDGKNKDKSITITDLPQTLLEMFDYSLLYPSQSLDSIFFSPTLFPYAGMSSFVNHGYLHHSILKAFSSANTLASIPSNYYSWMIHNGDHLNPESTWGHYFRMASPVTVMSDSSSPIWHHKKPHPLCEKLNLTTLMYVLFLYLYNKHQELPQVAMAKVQEITYNSKVQVPSHKIKLESLFPVISHIANNSLGINQPSLEQALRDAKQVAFSAAASIFIQTLVPFGDSVSVQRLGSSWSIDSWLSCSRNSSDILQFESKEADIPGRVAEIQTRLQFLGPHLCRPSVERLEDARTEVEHLFRTEMKAILMMYEKAENIEKKRWGEFCKWIHTKSQKDTFWGLMLKQKLMTIQDLACLNAEVKTYLELKEAHKMKKLLDPHTPSPPAPSIPKLPDWASVMLTAICFLLLSEAYANMGKSILPVLCAVHVGAAKEKDRKKENLWGRRADFLIEDLLFHTNTCATSVTITEPAVVRVSIKAVAEKEEEEEKGEEKEEEEKEDEKELTEDIKVTATSNVDFRTLNGKTTWNCWLSKLPAASSLETEDCTWLINLSFAAEKVSKTKLSSSLLSQMTILTLTFPEAMGLVHQAERDINRIDNYPNALHYSEQGESLPDKDDKDQTISHSNKVLSHFAYAINSTIATVLKSYKEQTEEARALLLEAWNAYEPLAEDNKEEMMKRGTPFMDEKTTERFRSWYRNHVELTMPKDPKKKNDQEQEPDEEIFTSEYYHAFAGKVKTRTLGEIVVAKWNPMWQIGLVSLLLWTLRNRKDMVLCATIREISADPRCRVLWGRAPVTPVALDVAGDKKTTKKKKKTKKKKSKGSDEEGNGHDSDEKDEKDEKDEQDPEQPPPQPADGIEIRWEVSDWNRGKLSVVSPAPRQSVKIKFNRIEDKGKLVKKKTRTALAELLQARLVAKCEGGLESKASVSYHNFFSKPDEEVVKKLTKIQSDKEDAKYPLVRHLPLKLDKNYKADVQTRIFPLTYLVEIRDSILKHIVKAGITDSFSLVPWRVWICLGLFARFISFTNKPLPLDHLPFDNDDTAGVNYSILKTLAHHDMVCIDKSSEHVTLSPSVPAEIYFQFCQILAEHEEGGRSAPLPLEAVCTQTWSKYVLHPRALSTATSVADATLPASIVHQQRYLLEAIHVLQTQIIECIRSTRPVTIGRKTNSDVLDQTLQTVSPDQSRYLHTSLAHIMKSQIRTMESEVLAVYVNMLCVFLFGGALDVVYPTTPRSTSFCQWQFRSDIFSRSCLFHVLAYLDFMRWSLLHVGTIWNKDPLQPWRIFINERCREDASYGCASGKVTLKFVQYADGNNHVISKRFHMYQGEDEEEKEEEEKEAKTKITPDTQVRKHLLKMALDSHEQGKTRSFSFILLSSHDLKKQSEKTNKKNKKNQDEETGKPDLFVDELMEQWKEAMKHETNVGFLSKHSFATASGTDVIYVQKLSGGGKEQGRDFIVKILQQLEPFVWIVDASGFNAIMKVAESLLQTRTFKHFCWKSLYLLDPSFRTISNIKGRLHLSLFQSIHQVWTKHETLKQPDDLFEDTLFWVNPWRYLHLTPRGEEVCSSATNMCVFVNPVVHALL